MKLQILAAIIGLLPALVVSCAGYTNCLCQKNDGSYFDDAATAHACGNDHIKGDVEKFSDGRSYCTMLELPVAGVDDGGVAIFPIDNCKFADICYDWNHDYSSNCWDKY
ncbi:hypothetical protein BTUL_0160g00310 [Botrytis tulipae]|uniref:Uncharacterized protein n=1 Tax=Botrytis tulipae TaxID=87230 RepID=A0A4Z1EBD9_9HELO|nr:hypothetical protein BTUL_0160g00310 [Botrytis tulipae]